MTDDYRWVLQLIDRCYGAAVDDEHWPLLLKDINRFLEGDGLTLFFTDADLKPIDQFFSDNITPESIADYQAHFHTVDIRMQRAIPGALDSIVTDRDLVDEAIVKGHEFYQDFLRPIGHRYIVSAVMGLDGGGYAFCSSHRGLKQDHAESGVIEKAQLLIPHLRRSLQFRRRLLTERAQSRTTLDLLDGLGQAVFLVTSNGRILWQNGCADQIVRQQDGLITSDGELRALSATAGSELQGLIASAVETSDNPLVKPGGMMTIPRPSLKRSYQVLVTPLPKAPEMDITARQLQIVPSAAIFIMDLERKPVPSTELLRRLYNLTPAEARLATALGSGDTIKAYAEKTQLSVHYVRWLLKQVEAKTDTRRITDLIQLLARQSGFFGAVIDSHRGQDE